MSLNIHTQVAFNMNNFISLLSPTRAGQHIRPSTEILMLFCRAPSYVLVIFFELSLYLPVVVLFFPTLDFLWFFSFLSVLVEGIGDRIGVIKHKREVFVILTSERKAQAWEELLKDQRHIAFKTPVAYMLIFADLKRFFSAVHTLRWL